MNQWGLGAHTLGGEGVPAPSVPRTWHRLSVAVPSAGGAVVRLVAPGGIRYDTR